MRANVNLKLILLLQMHRGGGQHVMLGGHGAYVPRGVCVGGEGGGAKYPLEGIYHPEIMLIKLHNKQSMRCQ